MAKTTIVAHLGVALTQASQRCILVASAACRQLDSGTLSGRTLSEAKVLVEEGTHKDFEDVVLRDQQDVDLISEFGAGRRGD